MVINPRLRTVTVSNYINMHRLIKWLERWKNKMTPLFHLSLYVVLKLFRNEPFSKRALEDWRELAEWLLNNFQDDRLALEATHKATEIDERSKESWYLEAQIHEDKEEYADALAALNAAIGLDDHYLEARERRALILGKMNRYREALDEYLWLARLNNSYEPPWQEWGRLLEKHGKSSETLVAFSEGNNRCKNTNFWTSIGKRLGHNYFYLGRAIEAYDRAIACYNGNMEARNGKAKVLEMQGNCERAFEEYREAVHVESDYEPIWESWGHLLEKNGTYGEAITAYNEGLDRCEDTYFWTSLGNFFYHRFFTPIMALNAYRKASDCRYDNIYARKQEAFVLENLNRYYEAFGAYKEAVEIDSSDSALWQNWGRALKSYGSYKDALIAYQAGQNRCKEENFWLFLGNYFFSQITPDYEKALDCYNYAIEIDGKKAIYWCDKGLILSLLNRNEEALEAYRRAIEIDIGDKYAWNSMGRVLESLGRYKEARKSFDKALEYDKERDFADAWNNKGNLLYNHLGMYEDAFKAYNKVINIDEKFKIAWDNRGLALEGLGRYKEALKSYNRAIDLDRERIDAGVRYNKGNLLYNYLGRYEDALKAYEDAIRIDKNYTNAWDNRGLVLEKLGRYEEALESYKKALEIDRNHTDALNNKGGILLRLGNYKESLNVYEEALKLDDNNKYLWNNKGMALVKLGRYDEAFKSFDRATSIDKNYIKAWRNKGVALEKLECYKKALQVYNRAIKVDREGKYIDVRNDKGNLLYDHLGRYKEALIAYDEALKIDKKYIYAWHNKGLALKEMKRLKEALEAFDRALKIDENYYYAWNGKGNVFYSMERYDEALKAYDMAIKIDGSHSYIWNNRGRALERLSENDKALEAYSEAIRCDKEGSYIDARLNKANLLYILEKNDEALKCCNDVIAIDEENRGALNIKALILERKGNEEEAIDVYSLISEFPESIPIDILLLYHKGRILLNKKWNTEAKECLNRALVKCNNFFRDNKNRNNYYYRGIMGFIAYNLKRYHQAIRAFEKAIKYCKLKSYQSDYFCWIGTAYYYLEKYEIAIKNCKKAIELKKDNVDAWICLGAAIYENKKYDELGEAVWCCEKAEDINSEVAVIFSNLSEFYFDLGNSVKALEMADKALSIEAGNTNALINKVKVLVEKKQYEVAISVLKEAIKTKPGDIRVQLWQIYVHYLLTTYQESQLKTSDETGEDCKKVKNKEELTCIIRRLEQLDRLSKKIVSSEGKQIRAEILYLLAYFYLKNDDIYSAKNKLVKCIKLAKGERKKLAEELLNNVWNSLIKPSWWTWWLNSPIYRWPRRILFGIFSLVLLVVLIATILGPLLSIKFELLNITFIDFSVNLIRSDNPMVYILVAFLLYLLVMPSIQSFKAKDFELELQNLSSYDPTLSPSSIEEAIKKLASKIPESPLSARVRCKPQDDKDKLDPEKKAA